MNSNTLTPNRVNIKEANDHLQLLYSRINKLESIIKVQAEETIKLEQFHLKEMKDLKEVKDGFIQDMNEKIISLEAKIKILENEDIERKNKLNEAQARLSLLDHFIINMLPCLEGLINEISKISLNHKGDAIDERASSGIGIISASNGSVSDTTTINTDISGSDTFKSELSDHNLADYLNVKSFKSNIINNATENFHEKSYSNRKLF